VADDRFTFSLGADEIQVSVASWDELIRWLENERAQWTWLVRGGETDLPMQWASNVQNQWDQILNNVRSYQSQNQQLNVAPGALQPLGPGGSLLASPTTQGVQVLDIRVSAGDVAGAFAYAFLKAGGQIWQQVTRPDALLGILLTVLPDFRDVPSLEARLKQERRRFRDALTSGTARLESEFRDNEQRFDHLVNRGKQLALDVLRKRSTEWRHQQTTIGNSGLEAIAEINSTRDAYLQYMQLQAPVEYWTKKAKAHRKAAFWSAVWLAVFFVVMTCVLGGAFYAAGDFLINEFPDTMHPAPSAIYVVVSGGLVVLSTLAFWIGRLLTRLYLSEHHLRTDAEERAVMTQTYLALTKESAATEAERQIILTALFRSSSDGIVKDDGMPDIGWQALLSKAALPR
jgi:hypothetical protein